MNEFISEAGEEDEHIIPQTPPEVPPGDMRFHPPTGNESLSDEE